VWLPRPRFTIAHLLVLVVIAGLVSTGVVGGRGEFMAVHRDESLCGRVGGILNMLNH
jgi:hypothetical protein